MRRCKIPAGCKLPHHPCCADCKDKACKARCWNSPNRCGCWENAPGSKGPIRERKSKLDTEELLRLHKQGLLQREIALRLGCSSSTVSAALRKMGVNRYG